ncbi:MAG: tryptophan 7-halogenase [Roseiflexaceae bacterium]
MERFDVAVVGGGPAGAAAALTLARAGRWVLLADSAPPGQARVGEGLPAAATPLLRDLGLLEQVQAGGHRPSYGTVSVWGAPVPQMADAISQWHGHGLQLDRARFDATLREAAQAAGATVRTGTRLAVEEPTPEGFWLRLLGPGGEATARCRWLIDASGRSARVARRLGATRQAADRLVAFHALLHAEGAGDHDGRTLIEATAQGWWYSVLLPSGERLVAYLTDADLVDRRGLLSAEGFRAQLAEAQHLDAHLRQHGYVICRAPRGADASSGRLDRFSGPGWLAVGDAALAFDPLSSQGLFNALYTGLRGGQAVHAALRGDGYATEAYGAQLARVYAAYLRNRAHYYAAETRWAGEPFWRRRAVSGR